MSVWLGLHWAAGSHRAGLGVCAQLITAMHCTAHVPRAYQGPIAFQGISSSQGLSPTCLVESPPRNPVRMEIREGVNLHLGAPPSLIPCPPRSGGG